MDETKEKKYVGYGYHGGGRPKKGPEARRQTVSISGSKTELEQLKQQAAAEGKTVSRYVLDSLLK